MESQFIDEGLRKSKLEEFLSEELQGAGYSHSEFRRTPMGIKVKIYAAKPGLVIGRGGEKIRELTEKMKNEFGFEDPQIDVEEIEKPELHAKIVANEIKSAVERGTNYRRVSGGILRSIMERGAAGAEIKVSGKLSGSRGRTDKFMDGYLKSTGEPAKELVDEAVAHAKTKPGTIGIKVRIMRELPDERKEDETEDKERKVEEDRIEETLGGSIADAKSDIESMAPDKGALERILDLEEEWKDRKGMKSFLEKEISEKEGE